MRSVGIVRRLADEAIGEPSAPITVLPMPAPAAAASGPGASGSARGQTRRGLGLLAVAAAVVIAVGVGFAAGNASQRTNLDGRAAEIAVLQDATSTALRIQAQPDAQLVALTPTPAGEDASGSLAFSPSTGELVAVATGLTPEASSEEYACWVEVDGQRRRLGRMFWAGDLWTWAGPVEGLDALPPGALFGVSLSAADSGTGQPVPVLTGSL